MGDQVAKDNAALAHPRLFRSLVWFVCIGMGLLYTVDVLEAIFPDQPADLVTRWGVGIGHFAVVLCLIGLGVASVLRKQPLRRRIAWASIAILQVFPAADWIRLGLAENVSSWRDYADAATHTIIALALLSQMVRVQYARKRDSDPTPN